jgi:hypothetical protein
VGKYIEWYLVELESRLANGVSESVRDDLLAEARTHLESAASEVEGEINTVDEAERIAVQRFGNPGKIAWRLLETHAPRAKQSLPKLPPMIAGATTVVLGACLSTGSMSVIYWVLYLIPLFWLLFCIFSARSRRARPWAIAGGVASAFLVVWVFISLAWIDLSSGGDMGIMPAWEKKAYEARINQQVLIQSLLIQEAQRGITAFETANLQGEREFQDGDGVGWKVPADIDHRKWVPGPQPNTSEAQEDYTAVSSLHEARVAWHTLGPKYVRSLQANIATSQWKLEALDRASKVSFLGVARKMFEALAPPAITWLILLLISNGVCVWVGEIVRRSIMRSSRVVIRS